MKYLGRFFQFGILLALFATAALAQDAPGRVARLEFMTGSVSVQPGGVDDWVQGSANRPLTNGDNVWADKDSRAELNVGTGLLRISSESSLTLSNVDNNAVQVQLHQGALSVHIRKLYDGEVYEVDTPNLAFTITKSGDYRFDVDPNADTTLVTVRKGEGQATGQGPAVQVHSGEQVSFSGGTSLQNQVNSAPPPDDFDQWCLGRDQREDNSVSSRYVAPGTVGADDLDANGTWRETPDYGPVWTPTAVAPDWAPYRYGHWIWVDPWGWTWDDDAPWGFAPFHYGRWVNWGGYWGWAPGPYWARPWYAPALVGWFGGPGFGIGFGFGFGVGWGWAPLGWGEPFFPWWRGCSRGYFRNVNISNTRITNINNVTNNYFNHGTTGGFYGGQHGIAPLPRYATSHNGLTTASSNTLQHSLPVASNMGKVTPSTLHNLANSSARGPEVTPTHESIVGSKAGQPAARPTSAAASRPTVSRMTPPATAARPGNSAASSARGPETAGARGPQTSAAGNKPSPSAPRAPEAAQGARTTASAQEGRSVPRPPQSLSSGNAGGSRGTFGSGQGTSPSRSEPTQTMNRNVPRPPSSMSNSGNRASESPNSNAGRSFGGNADNSAGRSVPRPPQGSVSRPVESAHNTAPNNSASSRSYSSPSSNASRSGGYSVPRPSGNIRPAPSYSASNGYSSRSSYGGMGSSSGSYRGYGERPTYGSPQGGSSSRYSAPSHSSGGGFHGSSGGGSHGGGSSSHGGGGGSHGGGGHR